MRRILASAMLALILAGGIMTFTASIMSVQAQDSDRHKHQCGDLNSEGAEDNPLDPC